MARIIVAGGGIGGTAAALMLARDGHEVTVFDRDPGPVPDSVDAAWGWDRRSVAQFRFAHLMLARGTAVLRQELPDVVERLVANGALRLNLVDAMLAGIDGAERTPEDDRFDAVTGRRTTIEWSFAATLADEPNVVVRRGTAIQGLLVGPSSAVAGVPHVVGLRLADGSEVLADLVIDATGRRSPTADWLTDIGARPPSEVTEDMGFTYTGRFYRSTDGELPVSLAPGLSAIGSISVLTIPSDNNTWSTTLYSASADAPMRRLRDPDVFARVVRECPLHAHWVDGEPISDVASMSGAVDRTRRFVLDGVPVATGVLSIADAAACTNPSVGRGMSFGLMHTVVMRDTVRRHLDDPVELSLAFHDATERQLDPWHEATRGFDRSSRALMQAAIEGREPEPDPFAAVGAALVAACHVDEQAVRWFGEIQGCLALPMEVFARDGALEHVMKVAAGVDARPIPGPDRQRLLELVA